MRIEHDGYVLEWNATSMTARLHTTTEPTEIRRSRKARRALTPALEAQRELLIRQPYTENSKQEWIIHNFLCQRLGVTR